MSPRWTPEQYVAALKRNPSLAPSEPVLAPAPKPSTEEPVRFTIPGTPCPKPRMTRRDVWKKRPCVVRYREWADRARACAPADLTQEPVCLNMVAYLPMPDSWPKKKREAMRGQLHRQKPDLSNICKAVEDALFERDEGIAFGTNVKRWEDNHGPRVEVEVR